MKNIITIFDLMFFPVLVVKLFIYFIRQVFCNVLFQFEMLDH